MKHEGNLVIEAKNITDYSMITEIEGECYLSTDCVAYLPLLKRCKNLYTNTVINLNSMERCGTVFLNNNSKMIAHSLKNSGEIMKSESAKIFEQCLNGGKKI